MSFSTIEWRQRLTTTTSTTNDYDDQGILYRHVCTERNEKHDCLLKRKNHSRGLRQCQRVQNDIVLGEANNKRSVYENQENIYLYVIFVIFFHIYYHEYIHICLVYIVVRTLQRSTRQTKLLTLASFSIRVMACVSCEWEENLLFRSGNTRLYFKNSKINDFHLTHIPFSV